MISYEIHAWCRFVLRWAPLTVWFLPEILTFFLNSPVFTTIFYFPWNNILHRAHFTPFISCPPVVSIFQGNLWRYWLLINYVAVIQNWFEDPMTNLRIVHVMTPHSPYYWMTQLPFQMSVPPIPKSKFHPVSSCLPKLLFFEPPALLNNMHYPRTCHVDWLPPKWSHGLPSVPSRE